MEKNKASYGKRMDFDLWKHRYHNMINPAILFFRHQNHIINVDFRIFSGPENKTLGFALIPGTVKHKGMILPILEMILEAPIAVLWAEA